MADKRQQSFRFRLPSWLAAAPSSSPGRQTPAARSSNQPAANSTPADTQPTNASSPTARQARPSDRTQPPKQSTATRKQASTAAQRQPSRPPGRATQTSNPQPQASKTGSSPPSSTRVNDRSPLGQQSSPSRAITQSEANPQPSTTSAPVGQKASPSRASNQSQANSQPSTISPPVGQKTSPSPATNQSKANPQPSATLPPVGQQTSPSPATTQSKAIPQPSTTSPPAGKQTSPSPATNQSQANPQPSTTSPPVGQQKTPSPDTNQYQANPQPSTTSPPVGQQISPSPATNKSQANPQPSTTLGAASQPKVTSPPPSPSRAASQLPSASQTAPEPQAESIKDSEVVTQPSSPGKTSRAVIHNSSQLPATLIEAPTSAFDKEEPVLASNSHSPLRETNIQRNEKARMSPRKEGPETPIPSHKSNSSNMNHQTEPIAESDVKPEVTKEVAEVVQETNNKELEEPKQEVNVVRRLASGSTEQIKEQQSVAVQSEQMMLNNQEAIGIKKMVTTPTPNVKQNKAATPQPRNKNVIGHSRQQQAIFKGEDIPLHKEIKDYISRFLLRKTVGDPRYSTDERPVSVITLAGENRGALMQLGSESSNKEKTLHIHRSYKLNPDEGTEATTDGEASSKRTESENQKTIEEDQVAENYINSNIQAINNSILFNSSITERNPGVHLVQIRTSTKPIKSTDKKEPLETHRAEFNITPAQKLTYEPTVRRRCLRGLLLESSDSDTDNPEKPRRHGCRVGCSPRNQSNNVDIL